MGKQHRWLAAITVFAAVSAWNIFIIPILNQRDYLENFYLVPVFAGILLFVIALVFGRRVPEYLKWIIFCYFFFWALYSALLGRTYAAGTSVETIRASFFAYLFLAFFLQAGLLRIIVRTKGNLILFALYPFFVVGLACVIASLEEYVFVKTYSSGTEAKARWSVSPSWLKYDASSGILIGGSD